MMVAVAVRPRPSNIFLHLVLRDSTRKAERINYWLEGLATQEHLPALDPVDPAAPVDRVQRLHLVERRVLPTGRVRLSWLATSLLRSRVRLLRCRGGRGRTVLRT